MSLVGYSIPFNVLGICGDGTREVITAGSLDFSGDVDLRCGHGGKPLARTGDGGLQLWQDSFGIIGLVIDDAVEELIDGRLHRRILRATATSRSSPAASTVRLILPPAAGALAVVGGSRR
jgi:hypothetical protein